MRRIELASLTSDDVQSLVCRLDTLIRSGEVIHQDRLLSERELIEVLGVSRRKLRQAVAVLERQGVVHTIPRSGTYVSLPDVLARPHGPTEEESNFQLMEVRLGLEPVAARLASRSATRGDVINIFHAMTQVEKKIHQHVAADDADTNFHLTIVKASHNPYITGMMMMVEHLIREHYAPFRRQMLRDPHLSHMFLKQHEAIYLAIRGHQSEAAAKAAEDHIVFSMETIKALTKQKKGVNRDGKPKGI